MIIQLTSLGRTFALVAMVALLAPTAVATDDGVPPVFSKLGLEEAKAKSLTDKRVLVVKATAVWCGPCKAMDRTTWRDAGVVKWFDEHGLAIQLDVDKEKAQAKELKISAMPTMVAFKEGKEFDRVVGLQTAEQLLAWLGRVSEGKRDADGLMDQLKAVRDGKADMGMQERLQLAQKLAQQNKLDEATIEFAWLWDNIVKEEPAMVGVRGSFMAGYMEQLAARHPPAKTKFQELRDAAEKTWNDKGPHKPMGVEALDDWVVLNGVVGEDQKTLDWFDKVAADPAWSSAIQRVSFRLERLLEEHERWKARGEMLKSPSAVLGRADEMLHLSTDRQLPENMKGMKDELAAVAWQSFRETVSKAYVSYLAAGRQKEAGVIATDALKKDDSAELRLSLIRWAIKAKQTNESQRAWIDEAKAKGDDRPGVREAFDKALAEQPK